MCGCKTGKGKNKKDCHSKVFTPRSQPREHTLSEKNLQIRIENLVHIHHAAAGKEDWSFLSREVGVAVKADPCVVSRAVKNSTSGEKSAARKAGGVGRASHRAQRRQMCLLVYSDSASGLATRRPRSMSWVFLRRRSQYQDEQFTYLQETSLE